MKKILITTVFILATLSMMAQRPERGRSTGPTRGQRQEITTLVLTASTTESFKVYLDGDIVNRYAQRQVEVQLPDRGSHDIYVVLERPAEKIAMMVYQPISNREECRVTYNTRNRALELILPEAYTQHYNGRPHSGTSSQPGIMPPPPPQHNYCSEQEVDLMVDMLHKESFDSTRDKLAMNFVQQHPMKANQILRLCQEFTFNSGKVDFLKKAYPYCVDPENYAIVTTALTFSSDKEQILNLINNNRR